MPAAPLKERGEEMSTYLPMARVTDPGFGTRRTYFGPMFDDRPDAGRRLARELHEYGSRDVLVVGVPMGGVLVAAEVARRLGADLDIVAARKISAPNATELTLGAVTSIGACSYVDEVIRELGISDGYLRAGVAEAMGAAAQQEATLRGPFGLQPVRGRTVIVVDDGTVTGGSLKAVVRALRKAYPAKVVVAVPVGSRAACGALREEADELHCLYEPQTFWATGLAYKDFRPVGEAEVRQLLAEFRAAAEHRSADA
jgi:predicted phosphoribosyltransferase